MNVLPIIILNYNSSEDCIKCVSFLKKQVDVDLEIIIVDNCSQTVDRDRIRGFCEVEGLTFLQGEENKGYSAGNNIGLRYAARQGYEYAVIANPDMEFPQVDYFSKMLVKIEEDSSIAALGTDIVDAEGNNQNPMRADSFWEEFSWTLSAIRGLFLRVRKLIVPQGASIAKRGESGYCAMLVGCCLMVRMDFLRLINFLDEGVFLYCEEPILAMQTKRAGKHLYYLAESIAVHMHIKGTKGCLIARLKILYKSRNYKNKYYSDYCSIACYIIYLSSVLRIFMQNVILKLMGSDR